MKITNQEELIMELLTNPIHKGELHDILSIYLDDSDRLKAYTDAVSERLNLQGNKPFNPLSDALTEYLQQELENRGYHTNNMWQIDDVQTKIDEYNEANETSIELTDTDKMSILCEAFNNDAAYSAIWECIEHELDQFIIDMDEEQ